MGLSSGEGLVGYSNGNIVRVDVIVQQKVHPIFSRSGKLKDIEIDHQLEGLPWLLDSGRVYRQVWSNRCSIVINNPYPSLKRAFSILKHGIYR